MAAHVSNFLQTNNKIVLDLINEQNSTALPQSAVSFGAPVEVVADEIATDLLVSSNQGSGYRGNVTMRYNRVPLSFMNDNEPDLVIETEAESTHGLIEFLNTTFGIQLTTADIVDAPITGLQPDVDTGVEVAANPASLVWHGDVLLQLTLTLITLSTVLTVTTLDGLYPPAPVGA